MKLSKKGAEKLRTFGDVYHWAAETGDFEDCNFAVDRFELEPDDVEGAVVLTIDEAKRIECKIRELENKLGLPNTRRFYHDRIKQAEGYVHIHASPMVGRLILPDEQAEGKK